VFYGGVLISNWWVRHHQIWTTSSLTAILDLRSRNFPGRHNLLNVPEIRRSNRASFFFASSCSQIRNTRQLVCRKARFTRRSRALFRANFFFQNERLPAGLRAVLGTAMPETTVHKDGEFDFVENEIRLAEDFLIASPAGDFVPLEQFCQR
jgi:hypothetical protein